MPRLVNISAVGDDEDNDYETDSTAMDRNEGTSASSVCPSTAPGAGKAGVSEARTYPPSRRERRDKKQHKLFLQICNTRHHHKKDCAPLAPEMDAETDAGLLRFGVGTYGETEQEVEREKMKLKEPRYGRKQHVVPTLRRRESVYDRLRRSSSFAQQSEDGKGGGGAGGGMRSLTNEKVAQRSTRKADERRRSLREGQPPAEEKGATPSLPPIAPARGERGGVMDAYGYFSTHRVNPYYYRELDHQQQHAAHCGAGTNSGSGEAAADGRRGSTRTGRRRSFMSGKVDAATGAPEGRQLYATKRSEDRRTTKTIDTKPHSNAHGADRRRETRQESLYQEGRPALKVV